MKNKKLVILIANIVLLVFGVILITQVVNATKSNTDDRKSKAQPNALPSPTGAGVPLGLAGVPLQFPNPVPPTSPGRGDEPVPTATPTKKATPTATPTHASQPTPKPTPAVSTPYRYFAAGMSVSEIQSEGKALTKQQVKLLIEKEVDGSWGVMQKDLGFSTKEKAYAFFLGMATRESTLSIDIETGSGPSHSYGALQAAEPSYADTNAGYAPEDNVPEMTQFPFTPENFYDPGISIYMGMRHLIHFSKEAKDAGYSGDQLLRHELIGYNTGVVTFSDESWIEQYSDEIGSLAGWYLTKSHLYDDQFTYTGDSSVDRSQPWGWY